MMDNLYNANGVFTPVRGLNILTAKAYFEAHFLDFKHDQKYPVSMVPGVKCDLFEVIWVKKGRGIFMVDLEQFILSDNTLYYLFPGQLHFFEPVGEVVGYRIAFSKEFFADSSSSNNSAFLVSTGLEHGVHVMKVNDGHPEEIENVVNAMVWECNNDFQLKFEIIKGLFKIFIAYFSREFETKQLVNVSRNNQIIFKNFLLLVEEKFRTLKLVSDYADELAVSPNYLSEVVKRSSGNSASYYIHKRIILEAKRLMATSEVSMKEIGFEIGFEDSSQFSKFFKLKTGFTFSEFRRHIRSAV